MMLGPTTCVILFTEAVKGVSSPMCLFLGRVTWSELVLMTVHRRFVGSFALNILSKGTTKWFWLVVNCVPL